MKITTEYKINSDLTAQLTDEDSLLTVFSEKHDDYDTYKIELGEWTLSFDSLTNKDDDAAEIWENEEFAKWAEDLKSVTSASECKSPLA